MLAQQYDNHKVNGWYCSEKFDGMRCLWDGGVSRGRRDCPYSNDKIIATGLWSRYGKVIKAPDWWLDKLPKIPLDGELWIGRGMFQTTMSIVKGQGDWSRVQFLAFDSPSPQELFADGQINNQLDKRSIDANDLLWFLKNWNGEYYTRLGTFYKDVYANLPMRVEQRLINEVPTEFEDGMEGYMLRNPWSIWVPKRSKVLLKVKPVKYSSGTVVGFTAGKGKHSGRIGSVRVSWGCVEFDLSGFTDAEREYPGNWTDGCYYPNELPYYTVTFSYRELSDSGVPKEARFVDGTRN